MLPVSLLAALLMPTAFGASPPSLVLIQQRADMMTKTRPGVWLGNSAPLSEKGYQLVAAEKSDEEMKAFIHRVVEKEARYVKDVAELSGFVSFYSGTQLVQNLETMKKELRNAPWVADGAGRNAALSEAGYQNVAKLRSKPHMVAFVRRILDSDFKKVSDEGALNGLVPFYDGEVSVQSFDQLKSELFSSSWVVSRDSEPELLPNSMPQVSLAERKPETKDAKQTAKLAEGCDDWCSSDLFVKVEANVTIMKNLSSWGMKCGWAHCAGCSTCSDPSTLMAVHDQYKRDVAEHEQSGKSASCQDWCSSEVFQAVKQNVTSAKEFLWETKCGWQNCGGCSKCSAHADVVNMRATASLSAVKSSEDPEEDEPVETTLATTTTAATTTAATTTLATTTLATTTLATTTLATTTLATTTLPTTTLPEEEEEEVEEVVELVEEAEETEPVAGTTGKDEKDQLDKKDAKQNAGKKDESNVKGKSQEHEKKEKDEHDKEDGSDKKVKKQDAKDKGATQKKGKEGKKDGKVLKEEKGSSDSEDKAEEPKKKGPLSWLFR